MTTKSIIYNIFLYDIYTNVLDTAIGYAYNLQPRAFSSNTNIEELYIVKLQQSFLNLMYFSFLEH